MKTVTLILFTPTGSSAEFTLLICSKVSKSFLMDLYSLYVGYTLPEESLEYVESIITLNVDKIINPDEWLNCIVWSKYQQIEKSASLELFIKRPEKSEFYYAVGISGILLLGRTNPNEMIKIHENTVEILCGKSRLYCNKPTIIWVDQNKAP